MAKDKKERIVEKPSALPEPPEVEEYRVGAPLISPFPFNFNHPP
jgi:hypothetical protein